MIRDLLEDLAAGTFLAACLLVPFLPGLLR